VGEGRGLVDRSEYQFLRDHGGPSGVAGVATANVGKNSHRLTAAATTQMELAQREIQTEEVALFFLMPLGR
jgi:hypothetical protein